MPLEISSCRRFSTASGDRSSGASSGGGCCLPFLFDFVFAVVFCGLPKPRACGGALRSPCSTLARARSAMTLMLLMISSRSDCGTAGQFLIWIKVNKRLPLMGDLRLEGIRNALSVAQCLSWRSSC